MTSVIGFGPFSLDSATGALQRGGVPLPMGQRATALLRILIERRDEVVSKDDLLQAAWPAQVVAESNLTVQVAALRKFLGNDEHGQPWVVTVARRGYRFNGVVRQAEEHAGLAPTSADKPAIAILPFDNMSGDPEQGYSSDGITHGIISACQNLPAYT